MAVAVAQEYEGTHACLPEGGGSVERDGVRTFYEVYGRGDPTILFLPSWSIVHARVWRNQIAYFARHFRVVVFDGRGNGRSDRPTDPAAYEPREFMADALAVMDATGTERAVTVSLSWGTVWNLGLAALTSERVMAAVFVGPTPYAVSGPFPAWATAPFNERFDSYDGFEAQNRYFIRDHYQEFVKFWWGICCPEPHSSRAVEFAVGMALDTTPEVILATLDASGLDRLHCAADRLAAAAAKLRPLAAQVHCPVLVVQGELDRVALPRWARALADDTGGELTMIEGAGHHPGGRKPVRFNLELRRFVELVAGC